MHSAPDFGGYGGYAAPGPAPSGPSHGEQPPSATPHSRRSNTMVSTPHTTQDVAPSPARGHRRVSRPLDPTTPRHTPTHTSHTSGGVHSSLPTHRAANDTYSYGAKIYHAMWYTGVDRWSGPALPLHHPQLPRCPPFAYPLLTPCLPPASPSSHMSLHSIIVQCVLPCRYLVLSCQPP